MLKRKLIKRFYKIVKRLRILKMIEFSNNIKHWKNKILSIRISFK